MRESIQSHLEYLKKRRDNRRHVLEEDEKSHRIVENRVISPHLAEIPGINYHLKHSQLIKESTGHMEVKDQYSHGSFRKGEIHQKYSQRP
jgi:hypothetical protein